MKKENKMSANKKDYYREILGDKRNLYMWAELIGLNTYEFDIIKRLIRIKKGTIKEDILKTIDLLDMYISDFDNIPNKYKGLDIKEWSHFDEIMYEKFKDKYKFVVTAIALILDNAKHKNLCNLKYAKSVLEEHFKILNSKS